MRLPITEIRRLIDAALRRHASQNPIDHAAGSVHASHLALLDSIKLRIYTDATRPSASTLGAGAVIYNSTDNGLNVSDGTNWRSPTWSVT